MSFFGLFPPNVEKLKAKGDVQGLIKALDYQKTDYVRRDAARALGDIGDARAVEPLVAALKDKDSGVRRLAAKALGLIGDPRAVEPLVAALKDKHSRVRYAAARALGDIGDARAVEPLVAALKDKDWDVGATVAEALAKIGGPAVQPLIAALNDKNSDVRSLAAWALGLIGHPRAVEPLVAVLKDKDSYVRSLAAKALQSLGWQPLDAAQRTLQLVTLHKFEEVALLGTDAVEPLAAVLKDKGESYSVRKAAAVALAKIGGPAVQPLIAALSDENSYVRECAAEALGLIGDPRAVEPLTAALNDENSDVRRRAAKALGLIGDPRAVEPLVMALKDKAWSVPQRAAEALLAMGPGAVESLVAALGDYETREIAAKTLVEIGPAAVEPLVMALKDKDSVVRRPAAVALGKIGDARALEPLLAQLKHPVFDSDRREVAVALAKIGGPAVQPLIASLNDENSDVRRLAAETLGRIGDVQAVEPLVTKLKDENHRVRNTVAEALQSLGWQPLDAAQRALQAVALYEFEEAALLGTDAAEPLAAVLKDKSVRHLARKALVRIGLAAKESLVAALEDEDFAVRKAAATALAEIGDTRGVKPMVAALKDGDWFVRPRAAEALGLIGDSRAVEPLVMALKDERTEVRLRSAEALESLAWQPMDDTQRVLQLIAYGRWDAIVTLGERAVQPLVAALNIEDKGIMRKAVDALGSIGSVRAVEPVVAALKDWNSDVTQAAAKALGKIGDARAVKPLVAALKHRGDWGDQKTKLEALEAVIRRVGATVEPDDLRAVAYLEGVVYESRQENIWDEVFYVDVEVDCSNVRRLARQELGRAWE